MPLSLMVNETIQTMRNYFAPLNETQNKEKGRHKGVPFTTLKCVNTMVIGLRIWVRVARTLITGILFPPNDTHSSSMGGQSAILQINASVVGTKLAASNLSYNEI